MAIFSPDFVFPGDRIGFGWWLDSHALEHKQFVAIGFQSAPVVFVPDYDLLSWDWDNKVAQEDWHSVHEATHEALRQRTGVEGLDLSVVDFDDPEYFLLWMDNHAFEHAQIRQALGIN